MDPYEFTKIPELSDDQKKSPYAHYYYEPVHPPAQEVFDAVRQGNEMDCSLALAPVDVKKLFIPGSLKKYNGYCVLPDDTGFLIIRTQARGYTKELENWFNGWISDPGYDNLNYKIWLPGLHLSPVGSEICEDIGWGPVTLEKVPDKYSGLQDILRASVSACDICIGMSSIMKPLNPEDAPFKYSLVRTVKLDASGADDVTCVWCGIHFIGGKPVRVIERGECVDLERVRLFASHIAWELERKYYLAPKLFALSKEQDRSLE